MRQFCHEVSSTAKKPNPEVVTDLIKNKKVIKLNIGCGTDYKRGWINVDNNSDNNIKKLDLNWDLRNPLPFADNSVDFVFNEHFFEHLTIEESEPIMADLMRVLKPGGIMRVAMPDLREVVKAYLDPNWNKKAFIKQFGLEFVQTPAEMLNMNFYWWGHRWLYDWEELQRRLKERGYNKYKKCSLRNSSHKELKNLETRDESRLIVEVTK
ncbi:MAG: methyltransferase domain-containing protein [Candidatus Saccharibacteria bacterium]